MEEPGFGPLTLGAIILALVGIWGAGIEKPRDNGPARIIMDSEKTACGGMAGAFGCRR